MHDGLGLPLLPALPALAGARGEGWDALAKTPEGPQRQRCRYLGALPAGGFAGGVDELPEPVVAITLARSTHSADELTVRLAVSHAAIVA